MASSQGRAPEPGAAHCLSQASAESLRWRGGCLDLPSLSLVRSKASSSFHMLLRMPRTLGTHKPP